MLNKMYVDRFKVLSKLMLILSKDKMYSKLRNRQCHFETGF